MENLLKEKIKFNYKEFENIIKNYKLNFIRYENPIVENTRLPTFVDIFYAYILNKNNIPTQNDFFNYYINENKNNLDLNLNDSEILEGLKARAFRTYPSLIRELHFILYIKYKNQFDDVIYDTKLDVIYGVDCLIWKDNFNFGIKLYTDTQRGNKYKNKKIDRHQDLEEIVKNFKYIGISKTLNSNKCGDFYLYSNEDYQYMLNQINDISGLSIKNTSDNKKSLQLF